MFNMSVVRLNTKHHGKNLIIGLLRSESGICYRIVTEIRYVSELMSNKNRNGKNRIRPLATDVCMRWFNTAGNINYFFR